MTYGLSSARWWQHASALRRREIFQRRREFKDSARIPISLIFDVIVPCEKLRSQIPRAYAFDVMQRNRLKINVSLVVTSLLSPAQYFHSSENHVLGWQKKLVTFLSTIWDAFLPISTPKPLIPLTNTFDRAILCMAWSPKTYRCRLATFFRVRRVKG